MKAQAIATGKQGVSAALREAAALKPHLALVFAPRQAWDEPAFVAGLALPGAIVIGCSTGAPFHTFRDDEASALVLRFDQSTVRAASARAASADDSYRAGLSLGDGLKAPDLRGIFLLGPGLGVNGSALCKGLKDAIGSVPVAGGFAGDGPRFQATRTFLNGNVFSDHVVAFGVYGAKAAMKSVTKSGWRPFGPIRRVTRSTGNLLHELDGRSAAQLYRDYLGDRFAASKAAGLDLPLCFLREEDRAETGIIRAPLAVDAADGGLVFGGDVPQGTLVRLMHAEENGLLATAGIAATPGRAAIIAGCAGRKRIFGDGPLDAEAFAAALGPGAPLCGFYGYGSIGNFSGGPDVVSQSISVTHIGEEGGG